MPQAGGFVTRRECLGAAGAVLTGNGCRPAFSQKMRLGSIL